MILRSLQEDTLNIRTESNDEGVFMFKDVLGAIKAAMSELNNLPDEIVDGDGADELPKEIGLGDETNGIEKEGLTDEEKQRIKEVTGWSAEIIDSFRSTAEYEIYKKAELQEVEIGEKKALIRNDIDWGQTDEKGRTNEERIKRGLAPLDKNGDSIELHHIGQHADSPLAELTFKEHRGDGNDTILHDKKKETETHGEGNNWDNERQNYWKDRNEYNEDAENNKGGKN